MPGLGGKPKRPGIRLHRSRTLARTRTVRRLGIPVTTPARTIADLRRVVPAKLVGSAIRQAEVIGLDIPDDVEADSTRSELERRFLGVCRRHQLPPPQVNARLGRFVVDFLWPDQHLIVETDGYRFHRGRQAFEDDRARDLDLQLRGFTVFRITYRQLTQDPAGVARGLQALL